MRHWTKDDIMRWHMEALPECTINEQRIKAHKEAKEFYDARKFGDYAAKLEELVDVYIANVALWLRYHDHNARLMVEFIETLKKWLDIAEAVDCKMEINAKRKFVKKYNEWRHEEDDE